MSRLASRLLPRFRRLGAATLAVSCIAYAGSGQQLTGFTQLLFWKRQNGPDSRSLSELAIAYTPKPKANNDASGSGQSDLPLVFTKDDQQGEAAEFRKRVERLVRGAQNEICRNAEAIDGGKFIEEKHTQDNEHRRGGGLTRVLQDSKVFSKAAVNTSIFYSTMPGSRLEMLKPHHKEIAALLDKEKEIKGNVKAFTASISLILHAQSPLVPTIHANYRYMEWQLPDGRVIAWFGGGSDLTPVYVNQEDGRYFHGVLKSACDRHDSAYYPKFKQWADTYFFNPFRGEARGIGGIFFDDLSTSAGKDKLLNFVQDCADNFSASYFPLVLKHKDESFTEAQTRFQQLRRGRYIEFNLQHDRGTKFGLAMPNARVESILASLPLTARWEYGYQPKPGSPEGETLDVLRKPRDWV